MAVTSQVRATTSVGEVFGPEWKRAGLLKPSVIKPVLTTVEKGLILRTLGQLEAADQITLRDALRLILDCYPTRLPSGLATTPPSPPPPGPPASSSASAP